MPTKQTLWCLSVSARVEDEEAIRGEVFAVTGAAPVIRSRPHAKTVQIECYLDTLSRARDGRRRLAHFSPRVRSLPYEDWAESWKRHFHVQRIGRHIVIKPSWRSHRPRRNDIVIELDPGMSFGTGQHPTTRFCLKLIERIAHRWSVFSRRDLGDSVRSSSFSLSSLACWKHKLKLELQTRANHTLIRFHRPLAHSPIRPFSLLDVGTGSGILALAAAKLGYAPVLAVDNDPQAIRVAKQNARNNRVAFPIRTVPLEALATSTKFDVVAANLLADIILDHRRKLASLVAPGGSLLLAGVLAKEAPAVRRAFRALGFSTCACEIQRNWAGFAFRKPNKKARP